MPTYKITLKVQTVDAPHESLGSAHFVTAATILDAYRKLSDVLREMPKPDPPTEDAPH